MTNREWSWLSPKGLEDKIVEFRCRLKPEWKVRDLIDNWEIFMHEEHEEHKELLKPCPFCGKIDTVGVFREDDVTPELKEVSSAPWGYAVLCDAQAGGCGSSSGYKSNKKDAIKLWNGRA